MLDFRISADIYSVFGMKDIIQIQINSYKPGVPLWDIGKQYSPRCDAAERGVPSGTILFAQRNSSKNEIKNKNHT